MPLHNKQQVSVSLQARISRFSCIFFRSLQVQEKEKRRNSMRQRRAACSREEQHAAAVQTKSPTSNRNPITLYISPALFLISQKSKCLDKNEHAMQDEQTNTSGFRSWVINCKMFINY